MIRKILRLRSTESVRCLSSSSIKHNSDNNFNDNLNKRPSTRSIKNSSSDELREKIYSYEPVEGEPIPPAKNRYINLKNPALHAFRPNDGVDESKTSFFMFPGQGSQFVGMGRNLLKSDVVKDLFERANQILGYNLQNICLNGPEETLNQTIYAQPAIFVTSLAGNQHV